MRHIPIVFEMLEETEPFFGPKANFKNKLVRGEVGDIKHQGYTGLTLTETCVDPDKLLK